MAVVAVVALLALLVLLVLLVLPVLSVLLAQGPPGVAGAPGPAGEKGANGQDGHDGANGSKGDKGDPGPAGEKGADGHDGAPGAAGTNGTNGTKGTDGRDGMQGPQGPQGSQGADGAPGRQGAAGAAGVDGKDVDTGAVVTAIKDSTTDLHNEISGLTGELKRFKQDFKDFTKPGPPAGDGVIAEPNTGDLKFALTGPLRGLSVGSSAVSMTFNLPWPGGGYRMFHISSRPESGSALDSFRILVRSALLVLVLLAEVYFIVKTLKEY